MSQRRDIERRLELYAELSDIMAAMKNMARVELHRIERRESLQQHCRREAERAADALADGDPGSSSRPARTTVYVVIGSERGFCGPFNETVMAHLNARTAPAGVAAFLAVGERLCTMIDPAYRSLAMEGATTASEVPGVLNRIVDAYNRVQAQGSGPVALRIVYHAGHRAEELQVMPPRASGERRSGQELRLRTNVPLAALAPEVERQYLYHAVLSVLYTSLKAENRMRLAQMENAMRHLEDASRSLHLRKNALRQEEIVQEIETMFSSPVLPGEPRRSSLAGSAV